MENKKINIALITDSNYFQPALVTIESLLSTTSRDIEVRCILTERNHINTEKLKEEIELKHPNSNVSFIYFDDSLLKDVKPKFHVSRAAYVKIYLPEILGDWDKCIFLDSDLLIRKEIGNLWDNSLQKDSNKGIAAVWNPGYVKDNAVIGLDDEEKTFNSGVMVMNLKNMRNNESSKALETFIKNFNHLTVLNDQAAFNAIFKRDWESIPLYWNAQYKLYLEGATKIGISKEDLIDIRKNPAILHFTTSSKPWKYRSQHPFKNEFLGYYKEIEGYVYDGRVTFIDTLKKIREFILLNYSKI